MKKNLLFMLVYVSYMLIMLLICFVWACGMSFLLTKLTAGTMVYGWGALTCFWVALGVSVVCFFERL